MLLTTVLEVVFEEEVEEAFADGKPQHHAVTHLFLPFNNIASVFKLPVPHL